MRRASELADPIDLPRATVRGVLGDGATSRVLDVESSERRLALKLGRNTAAAALLAHEARALIRGSSARVRAPLGVGWFVEHGSEVVRVEPGTAGALPALVLERLDARALAAGSLELALRVAADVGDTLAALHAGGIAHGDVKPANIIMTDGGATLVDFGLAGDADEVAIRGATPHYLPKESSAMGDARARDLFAFGMVLAELVEPALPAPFDELCAALLSPSPEARASAAWVSARAKAVLGEADLTLEAARDATAARIKNVYLRLRAAVLESPSERSFPSAPWLEPACAWGRELARFERRTGSTTALTPLGPASLDRWLAAVAGHRALWWSIASSFELDEARLADAMLRLAEHLPAYAWTSKEVVQALGAGSSAELPAVAAPPGGGSLAHDARRAAHVALELAKLPPNELAIRAVEDDAQAPAELVSVAAQALRLGGELGRARALAVRLEALGVPEHLATAAEIFRRSGDGDRAFELATRAAASHEARPRAFATIGRVLLERGDVNGALDVSKAADSPAGLEVLALARARLGEDAAALRACDAAASLPMTTEERARLGGLRGYVLATSDPAAAYGSYRAAAEHAVSSSALLEEATYLTGVSATGADEGFLREAASAGRRAALLWDHLGLSVRAARATLNAAAAEATARRVHEARDLALAARALALRGGDPRAAAFACCVTADVEERGSDAARRALEEAARLLADDDRDTLRVAARALHHGFLESQRREALDRVALASSGAATTAARMEWIAARLATSRTGAVTTDNGGPLAMAAVALLASRAPLRCRGELAAEALLHAREAGLGELALKLSRELVTLRATLMTRAGEAYAASSEASEWMRIARHESADGAADLPREQASRLEQLVRSLGPDVKLSELLRSVLDALVAWTGAERGLLLLRAPDGALVPKVARNLAQRDLGDEQLGLSMSLARRALERLEPVVAVDAAGELSDLHASVHALRLRSVLAVPLVAQGEAVGVVYLDDRVRRGAFGERELAWVRTVATLAATMVARAVTNAKLRRAASRAARRGKELERALADREARLLVAETSIQALTHRTRSESFREIIGHGDAIERTVRVAERVAASDVPVLVYGESGSGKELFARAIHRASGRATAPFVSENCSAIPDTLLESALFGHVRGAFTGADRTRVGLFEAADHGTLFLDEIGEMKLAMQTKLLRILEDGMVRPLGTERTRRVDVRLIAATHRDLEQMVGSKEFREDLFYRLSVIPVRVPPLRERRDDISLLVRHFIDKHAPGRTVRVTKAAMSALEGAPWPGNVRQLENEIRRALVLGEGVIDTDHLSLATAKEPQEPLGLDVRKRVDHLEIGLVREALAKTRGNQTQAAKLLGLSRFGLQKMMKRLKISATPDA